MKKKKPPVVLLTIVCVGIGAAFALNVKARPVDPRQQAIDDAETHRKSEPDTTADDVAKASGVHKVQSSAPDHPSMTKKGGGDGFVVTEKPKMQKPVPNNNSTSSEWYAKQ